MHKKLAAGDCIDASLKMIDELADGALFISMLNLLSQNGQFLFNQVKKLESSHYLHFKFIKLFLPATHSERFSNRFIPSSTIDRLYKEGIEKKKYVDF